MLAIQKSKESDKCRPHVLPCRMHHDGPVEASQRYWEPEIQSDGSVIAYFRGRKLVGTALKVPNGYRGAVLEKTSKLVEQTQMAESTDIEEDNELKKEAEDEEPECTAMDEVASFDDLVVWAHETQVNVSEDPFCKSVNEWINFAQAIHSWDEKTTDSSRPH